jgi:hypothetical protein
MSNIYSVIGLPSSMAPWAVASCAWPAWPLPRLPGLDASSSAPAAAASRLPGDRGDPVLGVLECPWKIQGS